MIILAIIGLIIVSFLGLGFCIHHIAKDMGGIIGTAVGENTVELEGAEEEDVEELDPEMEK